MRLVEEDPRASFCPSSVAVAWWIGKQLERERGGYRHGEMVDLVPRAQSTVRAQRVVVRG